MRELKYRQETLTSWRGIKDTLPEHDVRSGSWVFRGVANPDYYLWTSFERALLSAAQVQEPCFDARHTRLREILKGDRPFEFKAYDGTPQKRTVFELEMGLERAFLRKLQSVCPGMRVPQDRLEIQSLMQHYGAPTSLLDWSYSCWVALFMAIEAGGVQQRCAVWALNIDWLRTQVDRLLHSTEVALDDLDRNLQKEKAFENTFRRMGCPTSFVMPVNPYYLNPRLGAQQGLFLCSGNLTIPLEDNLAKVQDYDRCSAKNNLVLYTIDLTVAEKKTTVGELFRMNMYPVALYPDIQGFAKSMWTLLFFPRLVAPPDSKY